MRSILLHKTLGVGGFAALGESSKIFTGSISSQAAAFQHTKVDTPTAEAGDKPSSSANNPVISDPFDLEFDRFNGGAFADAESASRPPPRPPLDPLNRPVDLEFELDRDDPEVDAHNFYTGDEEVYDSPDDEDEELFEAATVVELDDEFDLTHDHAMGIVEPGPGESEQSKGTGGVGKTGSAFEKVRDAAAGGSGAS